MLEVKPFVEKALSQLTVATKEHGSVEDIAFSLELTDGSQVDGDSREKVLVKSASLSFVIKT